MKASGFSVGLRAAVVAIRVGGGAPGYGRAGFRPHDGHGLHVGAAEFQLRPPQLRAARSGAVQPAGEPGSAGGHDRRAIVGGAMLRRMGVVRMLRWSLAGTAAAMVLIAAAGSHFAFLLAGCALCGAFASGQFGLVAYVFVTRLFRATSGACWPSTSRWPARLTSSSRWPPMGSWRRCAQAESLGIARDTASGWALRLPFAAMAGVLALAAAGFRSRWRRQGRPRLRAGRPAFVLPQPVIWLVVLMAMHGALDSTWPTGCPPSSRAPASASHC